MISQLFHIPVTSQALDFLTGAWIMSLCAAILLLLAVLASWWQHTEHLEKTEQSLGAADVQAKITIAAAERQLLTVAHQIKTPLAVIKGYASMLEDGDYGRLSPAQIEAVKAIFQSSDRLIALAGDMLAAARLEESELFPNSRSLNGSMVDVRQMVADVIRELEPRAREKDLYVYFDHVGHHAPTVAGNAMELRQAVMNIVDNAIRYTPSGGVTVRMVADGKGVRLSVSDTGIGISAEDQRRLFDKFFRAENAKSRAEDGTGMGMYIAKRIAEAHGGSVWAESEGHHKGSTFHMWLPLQQAQGLKIPVKAAAKKPLRKTAAKKKK